MRQGQRVPIFDDELSLRVMYCWACCRFGLANGMIDFAGFTNERRLFYGD